MRRSFIPAPRHIYGGRKVNKCFYMKDMIYEHQRSGGFMGDLVFNGGKYGIWVGNQQ
jgi:hypothetical protein